MKRILDKTRFLIEFFLLSRKRFRSQEDNFNFQRKQAEGVYQDLKEIFHVPKDSFVIDFGCGTGGYTNFFGEKFTEVLGVDYFTDPINKNNNVQFLSVDLLEFNTPKKADLVFCSSVIEHVENQDKLVKVIYDSLKDGGYFYLSFPPFYSLGGGHNIKPFHYLPEKLSIKIARTVGLTIIDENATDYTNLFGPVGLYKRHISGVKKLLMDNKFIILTCKTRYLPLNTARIPFIGELLTWHVEFYCKKQ